MRQSRYLVVPKYSNPQGITYSDEDGSPFCKIKRKAKDFRIYWDNEYCVHHLYDLNQDHLIEILKNAREQRKPGYGLQILSLQQDPHPCSGVYI